MLYSRYGAGAKDVLLMPFDEGIELLITAQRMNDEEKLFMRWVFSYQTQMPYEKFKAQLQNNQIEDNRSEDEILDSVKHILEVAHGTEYI